MLSEKRVSETPVVVEGFRVGQQVYSLNSGWLLMEKACFARLYNSSSLRSLCGAMPVSVGSNAVGVGSKQPVTIRMLLFNAISKLLVCTLQHHAGAAYSAALYTMASAAVRSVLALSPQLVLARQRMKLFLASILLRRASRCGRKVSCLQLHSKVGKVLVVG